MENISASLCNSLLLSLYIEVIKILTLQVLTPPGFKLEMREQNIIKFLTSIYVHIILLPVLTGELCK